MDTMAFSESSPSNLRLSSFVGSPSHNNQIQLSNSPIKLAEAGFQRPDDAISDEVFCKYCGLIYSGWEGESPLATHRILRPFCTFLNPPAPSTSTPAAAISSLPVSSPFPHGSESHNDHFTSLSPSSEFLSSSFIRDMLSSNNTNNSSVRRQLFPNTNNTITSLSQSSTSSSKLFRPKHKLGFLALFESHRLLTFLNPFTFEAAIYAKCGFVYNSQSSSLMYVFCNVEFEDMIPDCSEIRVEMLHENKVPTCPFVSGIDVGNISRECERSVRDKARNNEFCCSLDHIRGCGNLEFAIKHPEFEDLESRIGTFDSWPKLLEDKFPGNQMAECGFYFTGLMDGVRCYCCGVGLRNWEDADPSVQHSRASPFCQFMLMLKGQDFINDAQDAELTVVVDYSEMSSTQDSDTESDSGCSTGSACSTPSSTCSSSSFSSSSSSSPSSPSLPLSHLVGSPVLDLEAAKAATCQYTLEQIADAVHKFFISSRGQYPNEPLLLGTLKAADENIKQICQQQQEIINKDTQHQAAIQAKDTQLHAKDSQLRAVIRVNQAQERELEETRQNLQYHGRGDLEQLLVQKDEELEQKDEIIEQNREELVQKDEQLVQKDGVIEQNREELEQKDNLLCLKSKEVEDLNRHIQSLLQELRRKELALELALPDQQDTTAGVQNQPPVPATLSEDDFPVARCTVCYSNPSQIVFQPCGHLCCCDQCASKLMGKKCPICREENVGVDKVYIMSA